MTRMFICGAVREMSASARSTRNRARITGAAMRTPRMNICLAKSMTPVMSSGVKKSPPGGTISKLLPRARNRCRCPFRLRKVSMVHM